MVENLFLLFYFYYFVQNKIIISIMTQKYNIINKIHEFGSADNSVI